MSIASRIDRCLVFSQDHKLRTRLSGCLQEVAEVAVFTRKVDLSDALEQFNPAIIMVDALADDSREVLAEILESFPLCLAILLGEERSTPVLDAEGLGVFAVESPECPRKRLRRLFEMARRHLHVLVDREQLQHRVSSETAKRRAAPAVRETRLCTPGPFGMTNDMDELLNRSLHWMRECHSLGSVALFLQEPTSTAPGYGLRAGIKNPPEVARLLYEETHPLVKWLRLHPTVIHRDRLPEIMVHHANAAKALERGLGEMIAEAIIPVYGNSDFLGWLAVGHSADGSRIPEVELARISQSADYLGSAIERCVLHNDIERQRKFSETVLDALSIGVIVTGGKGEVAWMNQAAAEICMVNRNTVTKQSVSRLGSSLAGLLGRQHEVQGRSVEQFWTHPQSKTDYHVVVHPTEGKADNHGVFAIIQEADRRESWKTESGSKVPSRVEARTSTVSTEIRGPLVAIKTFVQLLPERFREREFREQFVSVVNQEVERLHELSKCLEGLSLPEDRKPWQATEAGEILRLAIDDVCGTGKISETEIYVSSESGILLRLDEPETLTGVLSTIFSFMITGPMASSRPRLWVETYLETDEKTGSSCVFSFRGEGAAKLDLGARETSEISASSWNSLKSRIANLQGRVNFGYNKKRSYVTLQLPTH
ncbi:MAG: hypothetical protein AAGJ79_05145 [Verrucomicrobiota bacterium]